jgi:hypothetical protein
VFEASKGRLKVVGRAGVGIDNVDLTAATEVRLHQAGWCAGRAGQGRAAHDLGATCRPARLNAGALSSRRSGPIQFCPDRSACALLAYLPAVGAERRPCRERTHGQHGGRGGARHRPAVRHGALRAAGGCWLAVRRR